jgi:beta-lactamase regulating signal transducer with metallopeptidase domain
MGLFDFALRATVLLLAAWLATSILRRASAATRHLVWATAIAAVLALPLLGAVVPAWRVAIMPAVVSTATPAGTPALSLPTPEREVNSATSAAPAVLDPAPAEVARSLSVELRQRVASSVTPARVLVVAWLLLALLLLARLAIANARVAAWQRSSRPVEDGRWLTLLGRLSRQYGIVRPVVLLENEDTDVPVTWGVVYPVVLLPAGAGEWDEEQRIAVLTHELAHVKRFDAFTQLLAQLALALLWFHPMVWMAVRRMRLEREHACDDFVLVAGARASRYADDLLRFARRLSRPTAPAAAALAMARRSELEGRLLAILDPATKRTTVRRARVGLLMLGVIAFAAPLAAFRPARAEAEGPPKAASVVVDSPADAPATHHMEPLAEQVAPPAPPLPLPTPSASQLGVSLLGEGRMTTPLARVPTDTEPPLRPVDLQTLIDVTRHAKKMTSDHEKGQLLASIAKRYVRSDELRDAYLETVFSMTSDHERTKALIALLERDSIPVSSTARVLRSAAMMTSDVSRGQVLRKISPATFADSTVQRAYLDVIVSMTSNVERSSAITSLMTQPLTVPVQLALLRATSAITSNTDKANVLLRFVERQGVADSTVRRSFLKAAETLTSDSDYRRVMMAVMR